MAKAIEQTRSGGGHAALGRFGQGRGSVAQQVHDGDTVTVEADGNLGVRLVEGGRAGGERADAAGHRWSPYMNT